MKKGISLVALIITIIVLIILTAAVVITGVNTPENAQLAVFMNNISTLQEAVTLKMMNNQSKYVTEDVNLENYKWVGIIDGYTEETAETSAPNFEGATKVINGVNVLALSEDLANSLSIDKSSLGATGEYYIDQNALVYNEGFTYKGVTYYNQTVITGIPESDQGEIISGGTERVLSSIAITTPPTKTQYIVGESLDLTGMVVTATYTNGEIAILDSTNNVTITRTFANNNILITSYEMVPNSTQRLTNVDNNITITYTEEGIAKVATQPIEVMGTTLADLIGNDATYYGKRIDYTAGLVGNEVTDWKVFYKQTVAGEDYVYLITTHKLTTAQTPVITGMTNATIGEWGAVTYWSAVPTVNEVEIAQIYFMANWQSSDISLEGKAKYNTNNNARCLSQVLNTNLWSVFANTVTYGNDSLIGAIGSPTAEMWVSSWNQSGGINLVLSENGTTGYYINDSNSLSGLSTTNALYFPLGSDYNYRLASPSSIGTNHLMVVYGNAISDDAGYDKGYNGVRPVVCLKADIPAYWEDEETKDVIKFGVRAN
ncbi:MAG: bacterial Ig-like domain-containing protein [Clostridia bacterium]|nr:bacterial Ig-like domain-containing protein [Clostridia bacterium]